MPEGDTIHYAASRIRSVLANEVPEEIRVHRRFERDRWPERLGGRRVRAVDAHGKHLFIRFEGGLTLHSHLRMTGAWRVQAAGSTQWPRSPRRAWLVLRRGDWHVIQFDGPVLELMTDSRTRFDPVLAQLGPDVLAPELDEPTFLRRFREDDPTRPLGDTLLDQRVIAGLGTVWRSEACWLARLDPWRPAGRVADEEALEAVRLVRPHMLESARHGPRDRPRNVYGRAGLPCPRCGPAGRIRAATQGDNNRPLYWCPSCQT